MLEMKEREYASSTAPRKVAAVKSFFHFMYEHQYLRKDPADQLDSPKVERHLPSSITAEEVDRLLAAPSESSITGVRDRALLELLYATGLRVSEVVALDVADVDTSARTVRCLGKGKKERILPIYERAIAPLMRYLTEARPKLVEDSEAEKAFFVNRRGHRLTRRACG